MIRVIFSRISGHIVESEPMTYSLRITTVVLGLIAGYTLPMPIAFSAPINALVSPAGAVHLEQHGKRIGTLIPGLFESEWKSATMNDATKRPGSVPGKRRNHIVAPSGIEVDVELRFSNEANGLKLEYRLTPRESIVLNSLHVTLELPANEWKEGRYRANEQPGVLPTQLKNTVLHSSALQELSLTRASGNSIKLQLLSAANVLLQDDRQWGQTFSVRIGSQASEAERWEAGKTFAISFMVSSNDGLLVEEDSPTTIVEDDTWLPIEPSLDVEPGSALDFSQVLDNHAPAGKHGRVIVNADGKFAFSKSPQKPARFYGINLCFSSQFLEAELADRLADRLWRSGYNALRIHHYEGELVDRSDPKHLKLIPEKLKQLDYLFAALKNRGIYVTTDLFVSRPVTKAVIYPGESGDMAMDDYKMAVPVNERAYQDYKSFARLLLEHVNPYTKVRYADEPALAWLSLINENCPGNFVANLQGPLRNDWQRAWNRWLSTRFPDRSSLSAVVGDLPQGQDPFQGSVPLQNVYEHSKIATLFNVFLAETELNFFKRTREFLREELNCRALLTDMNAWTNPVQMQAVRSSFDYVDDHFYVDHPEFLEKPWALPSSCPNTSPLAEGAPGGRNCAFTRLFGKPFTITEYNYSSPGRYRGVGGILTGTLGGIQDWDGIWRFAYAHSRENVLRPAALNYFDVSADPLNQAAERASLCLFLRSDIQPATHFVSLDSSAKHLLDSPSTSRDKTPEWHAIAWLTRVGWRIDHPGVGNNNSISLSLGTTSREPFDEKIGVEIVKHGQANQWLTPSNVTSFSQNRLQSETGEVTIDATANQLVLDTERTAGGFAPSGGILRTRAATIEIKETDATVWISSLDRLPIAHSKRLLITHLTDVQNTNTRYGDRARRVLQDWGHLPHLMQHGRAQMKLRIDNAAEAKVYGLTTSGHRRSQIKTTLEGGLLNIPLSVRDGKDARMLYELVIKK